MALSYEESIALLKKENSEVKRKVRSVSEPSVVSEEDSFTFIKNGVYAYYTKYVDENYSYVDKDTKSVTVDPTQVNLTQETMSQFIPFEMSRYYDGIDLTEMVIQIHYLNTQGNEYYATVVNVCYNSEKIRFGWLVDTNATALAGDVMFEIIASGSNEKGESYIWKSRPNGKINIEASLSGNGMIEPDDDWYSGFLNTINSKIGEAAASASQAASSAESASQALIQMDSKLATVTEDVTTAVTANLNTTLSKYYTSAQVDALLADIDLSDVYDKIDNIDGLAKFNVTYNTSTNTLSFYNGTTLIKLIALNSDPSADWVSSYNKIVDDKIAVVKTDLDSYKESTDADLQSLHNDIDGLPETLASDYYKKKDVDQLLDGKASASDLDTVTNDLTIVKNSVTEIESNVTTLSSDVANMQEVIDKIDNITVNEYEATYEENVFTLLENGEVKNQFTIVGGGGGGTDTSTITIERITPDNAVVLLGDTAIIKYRFTSVDNTGDTTGSGTASWRVGSTTVATSTAVQGENSFDITQYLKTGANTIRLTITDSFGTVSAKTWTVTIVEFKLESNFDDTLFYSDDVTFRYTPYGDISKQIIFMLDGKTIGGTTTSVTGRQMTQAIPKQSHGAHLLEVYMTATIDEQTVRSSSIFKDIMWVDPAKTDPIIGCSTQDFTMTQYNTTNISYVVYDPQNNPASISLLENDVVSATLSVGRTVQTWSYRPTSTGNKRLTIKCGSVSKSIDVEVEELGIDIEPVTTNLAMDFNPVGRNNNDTDRLWTDGTNSMSVSDNFDWSNGGYQIDENGDTYFCVKAGTSAVISYKLFADDAKKTGKEFKFAYKCTNVRDYDGQVLSCKNGNIGFEVYAQNAILTSEQNTMSVPFCEDNFMELEFNILPDSEYTEMVIWIDGIPCAVELYSASDSFTQAAPQGITVGSDDCDVWIYRMKAYTMNLTDDEMLDNFIADAKNANEIINRYTRNNILDSSGNLDPDLLAEKCPDLRIIKIETPRFTTGKKDKVSATSFQQIFKNGRAKDNWTSLAGVFQGQGTSSEYYGESGRNLDLNCTGGFTFSDGTTADLYDMTENSVPVNYFNIKVNVASSENINNSGMAEEYNTFNPYLRQARKDNPKVRDTMEFHPCVVFVKETDLDNSVEFHDGQWHFYACGNIGNSKKNSDAMGMDPANHKEFIVEVSNNTDDQCRFMSDDLTNEGWDGDTSFEMRYENPDCSDEELQAGKDAWQALLTWTKNATPQTFVAEFDNHFVRDSVFFFYLFTERHTLVDNRAKNTFWHTEDLVHWDLCFDYDNDTAMGNDNEGGLTLTYGYEDTDVIGTKSVFNASDSKVFCYVRDYFSAELDAMFLSLESQLAWSASRILTKFEEEQALKPERLWVMDMRRKYFRTYEDNGTTSYLPMMHGDKKHQRRQFQKYQEKYMSSKHVGSTCTSDVITIRGYTPTQWTGVEPDGTFHIVPYADTYIVNRFGSNLTKVRGKRGQTYEVKSPIATMNDTEVYTYNASLIQSIGDIAPFYPGYCNFNQGIKLTDLTIGSGVEGYSNTNMTDFGIGQNILLEYLDLRNLPNLQKTIGLQDCTNLLTFLADGSGITGVILPSGGKIATVHVPGISSLTGKDIYYLTDFQVSSYVNLTTLSLDNCPTLDELSILDSAPNLTRVRLTGIDWTLESTDLLDRLLKLSGIDENGYNTVTSVLTGKASVPVMREQQLANYQAAWPDLDIVYSTLINQYSVTFINDDGTVLDIQYVDKGTAPVDPITREENPIDTPTKESTVSTDYTFSGWDTNFVAVFANITITAVYKETTRKYTIRYLNKGQVLQATSAEYGTSVFYSGDAPTYTAEETAYKFYLFSGWDKSSLVLGNKDINAVYDTCEYNAGYFEGKEISDLMPVEIYAMVKLGLESNYVAVKDALSIELGHDYNYTDIEQKQLISEETVFNGSNYVDTGLSIMDEDRSFVLAIDYKLNSGNSASAVLAQCYQNNGMNGFMLSYGDNPKLTWGTSAMQPSALDNREMLVLRHIKGEYGLHVYTSNISGEDISYTELSRTRSTVIPSTLVFGAGKADDGAFENYAKGSIYWSKVWYTDLGDDACRELASWTHETVSFEMCGFKRYYLSDNSSKRCSMTFLASNLLSRNMILNNSSLNTGGWAACSLNTFLNSRFLSAFPVQWKQLLKQVKVSSSIGNKSTEISSSDCYIFIPAAIEVDPTMTTEPYGYEGTPIEYLTTNASRVCSYADGDDAAYLLRTPNLSYTSYWYRVDSDGSLYGYFYAYNEGAVRVMLSI